jgi:hypothetical protein
MPLPPPMTDDFRIFLETVFEDGERVAIGEGRRNDNGEIEPDYGDTRLRKMWMQTGPPRNLLGVFARINPMSYRGAKNNDVTAYRHTLIEFDWDKNRQPVPKEIQYAALVKSGFPISAIMDSGNKSLHGLIRVDAVDKTQYELNESQSSTIISGNTSILTIAIKPKVNAGYRVANVSFSMPTAIPRKSLVRSCSRSQSRAG